MRTLRRALRLTALGLHCLLGLLIGMAYWGKALDAPPGMRRRALTRWWLGNAAKIVGLRIQIRGTAPRQPALVAANHISWLDILAIATALPVGFVSKAEVRLWPVVGRLAVIGGTLFLQRGGRNAAADMAERIVEHLRAGQNVVIFPEGTTTDGRGVRRFHPRLFGSAISAEVPVLPVALGYPHPQGVNPVAPFVDDDTMGRHAWRVLGERNVNVAVSFLPVLVTRDSDRRSLSDGARQSIADVVSAQVS